MNGNERIVLRMEEHIMDWTLEQMQRINELQCFYLDKTNKVLEALEKGKIKIESYWKDCRNMAKSVRSDKQIREWQIVFECMENIIYNRYIE